jgi:hypothetical protein
MHNGAVHFGRLSRVVLTAAATLTIAALAACSSPAGAGQTPGLAPRDTVMTTAKPTRKDLTNKVSLAGKVELSPIFGLVAPKGGEVRYFDVQASSSTPTRPTAVANIWKNGVPTTVKVPAGATFAGRLVDDGSTVVAGMPIVSAKYAGYGITADIDGAQAYRLADKLGSVRAQITNGPGPFSCKVLGTIAALPAGTIPDPPPPPQQPATDPSAPPGVVVPVEPQQQDPGIDPSEATGMRLVCLPPKKIKLINGASVTIEIITAQAKNALVLPVEAVAGSQGKGQVDVVKPDGSRETRTVTLGMTDGEVIQIKSGLKEDETVAVPGPNLAPAPQGEGQPGFPVGK